MADWGFWEWVTYTSIFLGALIVAAEAGVASAPNLSKRRPKFSNSTIWKFLPISLMGISLLGIVGSRIYHEPVDSERLIESWGSAGTSNIHLNDDKTISASGALSSHILVRGRLLNNFDKQKWKMVGVCFHSARTGDMLDSPNISKSGKYEISDDDVYIKIPWNESFIEDLVGGSSTTQYSLLMVPNGVDLEQFSTLRQAHALGAQEVAAKASRP